MSVVISTNSAASLASNNLAASNQLLNRSLNRLSSGSKILNSSDDAGGLAVSMKLTATIRRQNAAATNILNAASFLQTQDGVLKITGNILSRIGELKTLHSDQTKNSEDLANYQTEFEQLQAQLSSLAGEKFNSKGLFNAAALTINTTTDGGMFSLGSVGLLSASSAPIELSYTDGTAGGADFLPFTPPGAGTLTVTSGGLFIQKDGGNYAHLDQVGDKAIYDGAGGWTFTGSGVTLTGSLTSGASTVTIEGSMNTAWLGTASFSTGATTETGSVANASNLGALSLGTIRNAITEIGTHRADNGAKQSRLQFAAEVLSVNKANLEAANSRITDVDIATESTQLARYNILVQAGTAMLSQANQSPQAALRLIG